MPASDTMFTGSIPALYDSNLGPLLFEPYARNIAEQAAVFKPVNVLETAAGTGIVTRELIRQLPPGAAYCATDLNQHMLDVAASKLVHPGLTWRQADATALPFEAMEFDCVVCQFGVMFFPDKLLAFQEARRVLAPGGHFLFNVWDDLSWNAAAETVQAAVAEFFPENPPDFPRRVPYGYHDATLIESTLEQAGFRVLSIERVARSGHAHSARDAAIGICQGSPLRNEIEIRSPGKLDAVTDMAAEALTKKFGAGPINPEMRALVVVAERDR